MYQEEHKFRFSEMRQKAGITLREFAKKSGYQLRTVHRWESGEYIPKLPVFNLLESLLGDKWETRAWTKKMTVIFPSLICLPALVE